MKQKRMAAVALASGILCALCVFAFMQAVQAQANEAREETLARYGGEQVEVYVAKRTIAAGERIDASAIETRSWVADLLPVDALRASETVVGRTATSTILQGEVVSERRFDVESDTLVVPDGMTAVSVPAKTVQAVGGALQAGMRVDVYVSGSTSTKVLARNVQVLATSLATGQTNSSQAWVTLAVSPASVQELVAASETAELYFTLPSSAEDGKASA